MKRTRANRRQIHPLVAAALVIAATAALTFYAFNGGLPFVHGFRVHAIVSAAESLRGNSPVRIAGVNVGTVDGVSRGPGDTADVTLELSNGALPLHTDATVQVRPRLFLEGSSYVDLSPGSPSAPILKQGGTIPLSQTRVAVQTYQALSIFDLPIRTAFKAVLRSLSQALTRGGAGSLRDTDAQLAPGLRDVSWIAQAARGTEPHDLAGFVHSASLLTTALARHRSQLADSITRLNTVATALASTGSALGGTIAGIDATLREAPPALASIDRALPPLTALSKTLDPALRVAPPLITRVDTAVGQLGALVAPAERTKLLAALRGVFVALPSLVQRLGGLFPVLKPVTDCVRTHIAPILLAKVPDGSLSTGQPVWQEFAHALVGLSGATQNFDANGYTLRILIGVGAETITAVLPGLGKVIGTLPGAGAILGARPQWVGDLTANVFHPEAPCASQPLPNLGSATAAPDFVATAPVTRPTLTQRAFDRLLSELRRR
ncbi:MAG TPA: MlaD family protein [Solirubrobacteraceae bacterium]|nr:MlaD family protein [Solirubrobacteraceae bacterium]